MEILIIIFSVLSVLFWLTINDLLDKLSVARAEFKRAADLYNSTFGSHYLRWFLKSRLKFRYLLFKCGIAFLSIGVSITSLMYYLYTYLLSL